MTSNNKIKQAHKSQNFSPHTRPEALADDLARVVRGDVFADIVHRAAYSTDASPYRILPECVVVPRDSSDIVAAVKYAGARGMPVAARGGASGVAGESLCSGIVFDMTRYMNRIISVQNSGETVVCEPGVILQELNNYLSAYGRKIGPDPSSRDHATVGGCVANNATGAHSLQYGYTAAYVESVEAVLADGSLVEISNNFDPENSEHEPVTSIAKQCLEILSPNQELIRRSQPRTRRNRSGYNIAGVCHDGRIDLARMLTGSEGTLAVFTKIKLRTVPLPEAKGLLQLEFDSLRKMSQAVPIIVDSGAVACELMDKTVIDLAIDSLPEYQDILPARVAAVLLVEHIGQTQQQVRGKIARTVSAVGALAYEKRIFLDDGQQTRIWKSRKDAGPLLCRLTDTRQPTEFMEDVSVPNDQLLAYITGLQKIAKKYDIVMPYYGHAGDGELHIRPYLDLSEPDGIEKFQRIAKEVFELAWSLGGSISGEHADGLVRAGFVKRQYGSEYYQLLVQIKKAFDPQGVLNPGKILNDDPDIMVKNLRARHKILPERLQTQMLFDKNELLVDLERCYGCGLCRGREAELRMCPVFRALGEEIGSTRSKANLLRFWAAGQISKNDFESPQFRKFLDLCVNCKACSFECPSGVDISELICVVRSAYVSSRGLRRAERVLSNNRYLSMLGSVFSPLSNLFMALPPLKWLLEKLTGLDRHRSMPKFNHGSFLKAGRKYLEACEAINKPVDKVAYFVDTYANYNDHELGFAVIDVLRQNNIEVILPKQRPAPLPAIVYGDVKSARRDLSYNVKYLAEAVRAGYKIVCSEPSAALCLRDELRHFVADDDAKLISENTFELMNYLWDLQKRGVLKNPQVNLGAKRAQEYVYHLPCHLAVVGDKRATIKLLRELCGIEVTDLGAGCCGLAGTFGMQKKNYELSSQIASGLKDALEKSPTKNVLTECAACKMQIEHISDKIVMHPIKILAEAYEDR